MRKGLSPLIATILIILIAVMAGVIIYGFTVEYIQAIQLEEEQENSKTPGKIHIRFEWRGESSIQDIPLAKLIGVTTCFGSSSRGERTQSECLQEELEGVEWDFRVNEIIVEFDGENWDVLVPFGG